MDELLWNKLHVYYIAFLFESRNLHSKSPNTCVNNGSMCRPGVPVWQEICCPGNKLTLTLTRMRWYCGDTILRHPLKHWDGWIVIKKLFCRVKKCQSQLISRSTFFLSRVRGKKLTFDTYATYIFLYSRLFWNNYFSVMSNTTQWIWNYKSSMLKWILSRGFDGGE